MKKCGCKFCREDHPEYLEAIKSKGLKAKNAAIKKYFNRWQMCEIDKSVLKSKLAGEWPPKDV
jgi:hypothetical protein